MVTNAYKKVLVTYHWMMHFSRVGASNATMLGMGADRFQKVYMLRR
jgi:hypothetical protein